MGDRSLPNSRQMHLEHPNIGKKSPSFLKAWLLILFGWILLMIGFGAWTGQSEFLGNTPWVIRIALAAVLPLVGTGMIYKGRAIRLRRKSERWTPSKAPFVLYLRSFQMDVDMSQHTKGYVRNLPLASREVELAKALRKVGTLLAVGHPKEELPNDLGAIRLYFADDWQERVQELMRQARYVILRPGPTQAVVWEMATGMKTVPPEHFVLHVDGLGGDQRTHYAKFLRQTAHLFPQHPLPETVDDICFVGFGANWEPNPAKRTLWNDFADGTAVLNAFCAATRSKHGLALVWKVLIALFVAQFLMWLVFWLFSLSLPNEATVDEEKYETIAEQARKETNSMTITTDDEGNMVEIDENGKSVIIEPRPKK